MCCVVSCVDRFVWATLHLLMLTNGAIRFEEAPFSRDSILQFRRGSAVYRKFTHVCWNASGSQYLWPGSVARM